MESTESETINAFFLEAAHLTAHLPVKIMVNPSSYSKYKVVKECKHIRSSKLAVCYGIDGPLIEDLPLEMGDFPVRYVSYDHPHGFHSFMERRPLPQHRFVPGTV